MNIEVVKQGKTVIQLDADEGGFHIMHPDGTIVWKRTKELAERTAKRWYKDQLGNDGAKAGLGEIEWKF